MSDLPQQRLFFALLPGARACAALQLLARQCVPARARPVQALDLHLTLAFLGSVAETALPQLRVVASAVSAAPCGVVLDQLERWRGGLLCATGVADPALLELHRQLLRAARDSGLMVEARPLRVHVTLARSVAATTQVPAGPIGPVRLRARSFCLMESRPQVDGRRYGVVARWRLDKARNVALQHIEGAVSV